MVRNLAEQVKKGIRETLHQFTLFPHKRQYRKYLEEHLYQLYAIRLDEDKLLAELADSQAFFTAEHIDQALRIGSTLSLFGLDCRLFDDQLYLQVLSDHPGIFADFDQANAFTNRLILETKAQRVLTAADLRLVAIIGYHRESEYWAAGGICPPTDSPYA